MVTKLTTGSPAIAALATKRQTVQLEVPRDPASLSQYFAKDAAGNVTIKNAQLKDLITQKALGVQKPGDTAAIKISVGVDF